MNLKTGRTPGDGSVPFSLLRKRTALPLILITITLLLIHAFGRSHTPRYVAPERFPRKIWQSWKVEPLRFEDRDSVRARSWTQKNPGHRYEVLTDDNAMNYVEDNFGPSALNRPDIVSVYQSLTAKIIQADLLRYLVLYVDGGVYADIDVEALQSIDNFIPKRHAEHDVDMVIGIETDEPDFRDHPILGSKAQSFCQWTFASKPRHPIMMKLIDNILAWLDELTHKQERSLSELEFNFDDVLSGTGPSAFTQAILAGMTEMSGRAVTWDDFHDIQESKLVAGVLVLPAEAFASESGHSRSGSGGGRLALVRHHYHASMWPSQHHRYRHPLYQEVERCNWNRECVELWDANTAFFEALPEEQQLKMIELKDSHSKPPTSAPDTKDNVPAAPHAQHEEKHKGLLDKLKALGSDDG